MAPSFCEKFAIRIRPIQLLMPRVSSENRDLFTVAMVQGGTIIGDRHFALFDAPLWNMALIASRLHWVWIGTVCVRMRTDFSYSNTLGWNTFPVPKLTEKNKDDLTAAQKTSCSPARRIFPLRLPISTNPTECLTTSASLMNATMKPLSASTSVAASATTPSVWKNYLNSTQK